MMHGNETDEDPIRTNEDNEVRDEVSDILTQHIAMVTDKDAAVLVERERCAKIVAEWKGLYWSVANAIAAKIREGK